MINMKHDLLMKKRNAVQNVCKTEESLSPKQSTIDFLLRYAAAYEVPQDEKGTKATLGVVLN